MAPKRNVLRPTERRNCIYCGDSFGIQGVVTHERFCKSRPQAQTPGERLEAEAIARLLHEEINPGITFDFCFSPTAF
jgi:hypothetical protein